MKSEALSRWLRAGILAAVMTAASTQQGCRLLMSDAKEIDSLVRTGTVAQVQAVLDAGFDINKRGYRGGSALWWAAIEGRKDMVVFLISKGADVNRTSPHYGNDTPLHVAGKKGHREIVELLLDAGANIEARSREGETPLMQAAYETEPEVVEFLISRGANVNARARDGLTAMHVPTPQVRPPGALVRVLKILISHGADVNARARSPKDYTPLMAVVCTGDTAALKVLLEAGTDLNVVGEFGTALQLAIKDEEMKQLLTKHGARK